MDEYIEAKRNIIRFQNESDITVLNFNNDITRDFAKSASSKVRYFNKETDNDSIFLNNGVITVKENGICTAVLDTKDITIPGAHNVENYMTAIGAVWGLVSIDNIKKVAGA
jgi:UDP-N-acetylmuramoylalanine--D-glutamate ligase